MRANLQVISERLDSFTGKRGKVTNKVLSLLDLDPEKPFLNTFDYTMSEEEAEKHSGKVQGKRIELAITNMEAAFGGRLRARGAIMKIIAA
jgi:hypothetical protein